jgi:hypothetical protein
MLRTFSGRRASQSEYELTSFVALLQERNVTRYLEIGARHGDTFHHVMTSLPPGSMGVALDLPGGNWGTESSRAPLERAVKDLVQRGYKASCLFGDSKSASTATLVARRGPYDAMLIDGDHTYAGVKGDFEIYEALAPVIAFHDIDGVGMRSKDEKDLEVEVPRFWQEVKQDRRYLEFIERGNPRPMGIGVLLPCE